MKVLAVIPARAGSKGIKDKNIIKICGKPLIQYTIEAACNSNQINEIIVSSDDHRVKEISQNYSVNFILRKKKLSADKTPIAEVILDLLSSNSSFLNYDAIMLLQPTAPIRESYHIDEAINKLNCDSNANSLISVAEMNEIHPARMYNFENGYLESLNILYQNRRRQEIPPVYYRNGSIYLVRMKEFLLTKSLMVPNILPYIMDKKYLCNIDEPLDLIVAEALIKNWSEN